MGPNCEVAACAWFVRGEERRRVEERGGGEEVLVWVSGGRGGEVDSRCLPVTGLHVSFESVYFCFKSSALLLPSVIDDANLF